MMELVESLPRSKKGTGHDRKAVLDWCIRKCNRVLDLREEIQNCKVAYEDSIVEESYGEKTSAIEMQLQREERTRNSRRAQILLQDYMLLLLAEDYLHNSDALSMSFTEWCHAKRNEQLNIISNAWVL